MSVEALHHQFAGRDGGPVLVLSHALGTSLSMWEPQVRPLGQHFRILRFDHRGHGRSPVPAGPYTIEELGRDASALLDRLGLERVSWCGLSMGGMVGMWLAINAPERIDRLVLCCTAPRMPRPEDMANRARTVRREGTAAVADSVVSRWLTPAFADAHPEVRDRLKGMIVATPDEGYAGCCEALAAMDMSEQLRQIKASTLWIAAGQDPSIPAEYQRPFAESIPAARFELVDNAAHVGNIEQPAAFTQLILEQVSGARSAPTPKRS